MILPQILGSLPTIFFRAATHHHHQRAPNLDIQTVHKCDAHLRGRRAALLARRRARPTRRRREVVAQLRRGSRGGFAPCDSVPALRLIERGGGGGTEVLVECRLAADLVARSKRAVSRRAEPFQRARWPASARQHCLLADPPAWQNTECAGCYQAEPLSLCWLHRLCAHTLPRRSSALFSALLPRNP